MHTFMPHDTLVSPSPRCSSVIGCCTYKRAAEGCLFYHHCLLPLPGWKPDIYRTINRVSSALGFIWVLLVPVFSGVLSGPQTITVLRNKTARAVITETTGIKKKQNTDPLLPLNEVSSAAKTAEAGDDVPARVMRLSGWNHKTNIYKLLTSLVNFIQPDDLR